MTEGNIFTLSTMGGGTPPRLDLRMGEGGGRYTTQPNRGYPTQPDWGGLHNPAWWGYPHLRTGGTPSSLTGGYPIQPRVPTSGWIGVPPIRLDRGTCQAGWGTSWEIEQHSAYLLRGGLYASFTQEYFLVTNDYQI